MVKTLQNFSVVAQNDATDSGNAIHSDDIAQKLGFTGGLVPGVTVYGYLTKPLVEFFGEELLEKGFISARFRRPVYEGETVSVAAQIVKNEGDKTTIEATVKNSKGEACALAVAEFPGREASSDLPLPEQSPLPESLRPATPEELETNPVLGTLHVKFDSEAGSRYSRGLEDYHQVYTRSAHPAWVLRQANIAIDKNLAVGPWIHVSSDVQLLGQISSGETFQVRTRAINLYEKNGHDYADFDVAIVTEQTVMRIRHQAIYRMKI